MKKIGREGLPLHTYHLGHVLFALPLSFLLMVICRITTLLTRDVDSSIPAIANRSLVLGFHRDLVYMCCAKTIYSDLKKRETAWIGIHDWKSYVGSLELYIRGIRCFRFDRALPQKPFDQIVEFLTTYDKPVFIRTDAGGPYDKVKTSAIRLAISSQRDIICFRQIGPAYIGMMKGHRFPLPFSKLLTGYSEPISWRELEKLPLEVAQKLIQEKMERVGIKLLATETT